jgi:hypothetical protein
MRQGAGRDLPDRRELFIRMNASLAQHVVIVPVLWRNGVSTVDKALHVDLAGWDSDLWRLGDGTSRREVRRAIGGAGSGGACAVKSRGGAR